MHYAMYIRACYADLATSRLRLLMDTMARAWRRVSRGSNDHLQQPHRSSGRETSWMRKLHDGPMRADTLVLETGRWLSCISIRAVNVKDSKLAKAPWIGWKSTREAWNCPWTFNDITISWSSAIGPWNMACFYMQENKAKINQMFYLEGILEPLWVICSGIEVISCERSMVEFRTMIHAGEMRIHSSCGAGVWRKPLPSIIRSKDSWESKQP